MPASSILYIFFFLVVLVFFIEYLNEKRYQAKRREERQKTTPRKPKEPKKKTPEKEKIPQEEPKQKIEEKPVAEELEEPIPDVIEEVQYEEEPEPEVKPEVKPVEIIEETKPETVVQKVEESKELPSCKYPPFTHVRLIEMGLSDDEATEFINELIPQLEEQVPLMEEAINSADFLKVERLTHGIKGSATNLGTGGISDLLIEFNTYLKTGIDTDTIKAYQKHFVQYIEELKKQYA